MLTVDTLTVTNRKEARRLIVTGIAHRCPGVAVHIVQHYAHETKKRQLIVCWYLKLATSLY